jgi:cytochrome c-type biogenesis protein CcmH/NrfF
MVSSGASTDDIDRTLVSEYGQTVLLTPPDAGGIPVLWIVPIIVLVGALGGVVVLFWRRSRDFGELKQGERTEAEVPA